MNAARRFIAPETVQTSAMDCGPAALKCLLEGFGIPVSYGRLREACQTSVDGTSIDRIEEVAQDLGLVGEQVMIPIDHLFLDSAPVLPALIVVRHASGATHFVVIWRRLGPYLQVMDPAVGRRWVHNRRFAEEIFRHQISVDAPDWRDWAATDDFLKPMQERLERLGIEPESRTVLIGHAMADPLWFRAAALDAGVRLVQTIVDAGGLKRGREALDLLASLLESTLNNIHDIFAVIPTDYWSVSPDLSNTDRSRMVLNLRGAVLVKFTGRRTDEVGDRPALSKELGLALTEKPTNPLRHIWGMLRVDGLLAPTALIGAMMIAAGAMLIEAMLFRGIFDIGDSLHLGSQRLLAVVALASFMMLVLGFQFPIISESMRFGRSLDARMRMALLNKLPHLTDRYFQSRPISDMTDRAHGIHQIRMVPGMGIHFVQSISDLTLTLFGIFLIDPMTAIGAGLIALVGLAMPLIFQPIINERDLRVRSHAGALNGFYLDSLLGLVPIRVHGAEPAVRHLHEGLLVEWARSSRRLVRAALLADGLQQVFGTGLAALLLIEHFIRQKGVSGGDLLLVYWVLKLPAAGHGLMSLAQQYPTQRNILLRLLEPLSAPEEDKATALPVRSREPVAIEIRGGAIVAAGHRILGDIDLSIRPGEHIAIVGPSGAGKSTLIGLLLGWHQLAEGEIRLDGAPFTGAHLPALRQETAWVDPAIQIWNEAFADNLTYSSGSAGLSSLTGVIDSAELRRVLQVLPDGLQTRLGEGGALLSGGEGQRVRLARAFAQTGVRLALLDEPFRGMDREQRKRLLTTARQHWRDKTLVCVTHDVGETRDFDRVLVIEQGAIIEDAHPDVLAARPSRYRDLLDAEDMLRDRLWQDANWRRVRVEAGHVQG